MQESHETSCEFFIASENTSVPLDFVDETFDDVAFSVAESVIVAWLLAIAAGRDDRLYLLSCEQRFSFCPAVHATGHRCAESSELPQQNGDTFPRALRRHEGVLAKMRTVSATDGRQFSL